MTVRGTSGVAFSGLVEALGVCVCGGVSARCWAGATCLQESSLAGGDGHVLAADIWHIRKRGVRVPWLLAGTFGLGSGDAEYQPATLAPSRLDPPSPVFLTKQTHSPVEQCVKYPADPPPPPASLYSGSPRVSDTLWFQGGIQVPREATPRLARNTTLPWLQSIGGRIFA